MKIKFYVFSLLALAVCMNGYGSKGVWVKKAAYGGGTMNSSCAFVIGDKAYMGASTVKNEFWEYDPATDVWTQKANFPHLRYDAMAFTIGSKGYMGTGVNNGCESDFYEYDPATNTWTQKATVGGGVRRGVAAFSLGGKGYASGGVCFPNYTDALWAYDPVANTWAAMQNMPATPRGEAFAFTIGNKAYVGGGNGPGSAFLSDFWEYDPAANAWTQKADFPFTSAYTSFAIGDKGYAGIRSNRHDFYEYDTLLNTWTRMTDYPGTLNSGEGNPSFSLAGKGYTYSSSGNELWQFNADSTYKCHHELMINSTPVTVCHAEDSMSESCFEWHVNLCKNQCMNITVAATGGTAPYTITWQHLGGTITLTPDTGSSSLVCLNSTPDISELFLIQLTDVEKCTTTVLCTLYTDVCTGIPPVDAANGIYAISNNNPSAASLKIVSEKFISAGVLDIYDVVGKKIGSETFVGKEKDIYCKMNPGIYFILLREGENTWTKKIIRE